MVTKSRPPLSLGKQAQSNLLVAATSLAIGFLVGFLARGWTVTTERQHDGGIFVRPHHGTPSLQTTTRRSHMPRHGSVLQLENVPKRPTSHLDSHGKFIQKQQLVEAFQTIPTLAGFSVATLQPNQRVEFHQHETMHELFYVLSGSGTIHVNGINYTATQGLFVHVTPRERHSMWASSETELKMIVCGLIDETRNRR